MENGRDAFWGANLFREASGVLRCSGYFVMAEFLDVFKCFYLYDLTLQDFPPKSKKGMSSSIAISHIEHSLDGVPFHEVTNIIAFAFALFLHLLPPPSPR